MLIGVEGTRVDVDIRVKLLDSNVVASCLKKLSYIPLPSEETTPPVTKMYFVSATFLRI